MPNAITWDEFESEISDLALLIQESGFKPECLVAVARGGWIPTRYLSDLLHIKTIASIGMSYLDTRRRQLDTYSLPSGITAMKHILVVEDMLESGKSLKFACEQMAQSGAMVKSACLYTTTSSQFIPDFFLRENHEDTVFPWENG